MKRDYIGNNGQEHRTFHVFIVGYILGLHRTL